MSCYLVSRTHIDTLLTLHASVNRRSHITSDDLTVLGRMLIRANIKSVNHRYPDTVGNPDRAPGPNRDNPEYAEADTYEWRAVPRAPDIVAGLKLIQCYEYQACEFPEYETSTAAVFCRTLRDALIARLPGYDAAPWGIH